MSEWLKWKNNAEEDRMEKAGNTLAREGWEREEMIKQGKAGKGRIYYGKEGWDRQEIIWQRKTGKARR